MRQKMVWKQERGSELDSDVNSGTEDMELVCSCVTKLISHIGLMLVKGGHQWKIISKAAQKHAEYYDSLC